MRSLVRLTLLCALALIGAPAFATTPAATVNGVSIHLDGDVEAQLNALEVRLLGQLIRLRGAGEDVVLSAHELGATFERARLLSWLEHRRENPDNAALRAPLRLDGERARARVARIAESYNRPAVDAQVNVESGEITPEQVGRTIDIWSSLEAIHQALNAQQTEVELVTLTLPPQRRASDLEGLTLNSVLGEYQTSHNVTKRERTHNLRVAAEKIDGMVLLPGEEFDFNGRVGERSLAGGFRPAPVIAGGELVDGVGGGACQIAGTLHAAAFFAGLEILERSPHSRPSSYIRLGLDAAVSYPNLNFRFRNNTDQPVMIRMSVEAGITKAQILGAGERPLVSFVRRIDSVIPFDERVIESSNLPAGVRVLTQRGVPGFRLTTWRVIRNEETRQARRQHESLQYPPTQQIWRLGTGEPAAEDYTPPAGDTHGEYRADEYFTSTQGPGVRGIQIVRRAGNTGRAGWTAERGMPAVEGRTWE